MRETPFQLNTPRYDANNTASLENVSVSNALTPGQSSFADQYGLNYEQALQVNPAALQTNTDYTNTLGSAGATTPQNGSSLSDTVGGLFGGGTSEADTYASSLGGVGNMDVGQLDKYKAMQAQDAYNSSQGFDYTGAINTGLSAFNTYNNYKLQNEKMDLYRTDLSMKWADQARRNNTRDAWSSAFKNA